MTCLEIYIAAVTAAEATRNAAIAAAGGNIVTISNALKAYTAACKAAQEAYDLCAASEGGGGGSK